MKKYKIADLIVEVDMNENYIPSEFDIFECDRRLEADLTWKVFDEEPPDLISNHKILDMGGFQLCSYDDKVITYYPDTDTYDIRMIVYENTYTKATFYLPKGYNNESEVEFVREKQCFLVFFQEAFFLAMLFKGGISIHSVSLIYKDKGYVFSALSGTGKTTHTNIWKDNYEVEILDGDVTVCRVIDGKPIIYGLPWSGSSNMFLNRSVELGGIVFLQQGEKNEAYIPGFAENFERLMARSFTALWFEEFLDYRFNIIMNILETGVTCHVLSCRPDLEAVNVIKEQIDNTM